MCTPTYVYAVISTARLGMPAMRCPWGSQGLLREGVPDLAAAHAGLDGVCYNVCYNGSVVKRVRASAASPENLITFPRSAVFGNISAKQRHYRNFKAYLLPAALPQL